MAAKQWMAAFGTALVLVLILALAAPAQDWVNPDGSRIRDSESDDPRSRVLDDEPETITRHGKDDDPQYELPHEFVPRAPFGSDPRMPRSVELPIPRGHLPPPGACRIWLPDRPPGHQPPPGACEPLEGRVPNGAVLVRG